MNFLDRMKVKSVVEALQVLAPDVEIKFVERVKLDEKIWFAILVRSKEDK